MPIKKTQIIETTPTFIIPGMLYIKLKTLNFKPSFFEIILKDLRTLSILKSSKFFLVESLFSSVECSKIKLIIEIITIVRSSLFHPMFKYDSGPLNNRPYTINLIISSRRNIPEMSSFSFKKT